MRYWIAAAVLCAAAGGAAAQSFQTALTLSPQERRALEARLSTILDYARADETTRFELPTGRSVTVLPYRKVRREQNGRPCRGYRIDLEGRDSRMAVDGFRCKRRNGEAWVIVEPELVLAQEGPGDRRPRTAAAGNQTRAANEPLYADDLFASPNPPQDDGPPPLPRPAPERDIATNAANGPVDAASADNAGNDGDAPFASRVAAVLGDGSGGTGASLAPVGTDPAPARTEPAPAAADSPAPVSPGVQERTGETAAAPARERPASSARRTEVAETSQARQPRNEGTGTSRFTAEPTRVVTESDATATPDFSRNSDIVAGLRDLHYLGDNDPATPETVEAAVDAFAVDERFALPISSDVLIARLDAAVERSETLPACAAATPNDLCAIPRQ